MARIDSKLLFLTTSPRTPEKMIPEIELLIQHFEGQSWNSENQIRFMEILREEQFFNGQGTNDPAFSARDRINRAPKSLGFIILSPAIQLTSAGKSLITSKRKEDTFLRQMLKFQIPSPYHKPSVKAADFWIKPYLEIIRLIRTMGTLRFDELQMFGMQLTHWHDFDKIVGKINTFREKKLNNVGSYREFKSKYLASELKTVFFERIKSGKIKTRESKDKSLKKFLDTQASNMRDYADSCFRYLRATGLINVSNVGKSLSIIPERIADVDFILATVDRDPCFVDDESNYVDYLGDSKIPQLLSDNREIILNRLHEDFPDKVFSDTLSTQTLKDILADLIEEKRNTVLHRQVRDIKDYKYYNEIQNTFEQIKKNELYDAPLILEWNTWRAMTMLDGGNINANLHFDDYGKPMSPAQGNIADIVCDYQDYMLAVEVTMASGQKQYEMEGEPVSRHLGKLKKATDKPAYALFIAPKINEACIAHFYLLHHLSLDMYGGQSVIVPLPLDFFQKMLEDSYKASYTPNSGHVRRFFEKSRELASLYNNEREWYEAILREASKWLKQA